MTCVRSCLVLAVLVALSGPVRAQGPAFHTEPSGSAAGNAIILERYRYEEGDFFGFVAIIERVGPSGREQQRYQVQCESTDTARPGVWQGRGREAQHVAIRPDQVPAASERLAYNLWWAVCRRLLQRY